MRFNHVTRARDLVPIKNVVVSVYDKDGLADFALKAAVLCPGIRFLATGGSYETLKAAFGAKADSVLLPMSQYTAQPEMAGGLVKTLDWKLYLGLLAEHGDERHEADLERCGAIAIDMVIGNLYPFAEAAAACTSALEDLRQRIDIGGPAMLRAAAKNFLRVAAVSSPAQYEAVLEELGRSHGSLSLGARHALARAAFDLTAGFDLLVAERLASLGPADLASAYALE